MLPYPWLEAAYKRIEKHIRQTPLTYDPELDLHLKWENYQVTGSFKARGALNKVLSLETWERQRGLVAASAGNHGQGVALAGKLVNSPVTIFASEHATPAKVIAMRSLGAEVRLIPGGYGEAELAGLEYARSANLTWISPYNDGQVIAGQGTLGMETVAQNPSLASACWLVPAGGGGLVSGIGAALQNLHPKPRLVAVQSEASTFLHSLFWRGTQQDVVEQESLADGLAGPVEPGSLTIPLASRLVDDFILVSEDAIAEGIRFAWHHYNETIEGSAAVTLAAILSGRVSSRPALAILTGGNIQPEIFAALVHPQASRDS